MNDSLPKRHEDNADGHVAYEDSTVSRKVSVKGTGGVTATVVVTVRHGKVWLSIEPPFTWSAILDSGRVDELMRTLAQAVTDAKKYPPRERS